jgi:hypothetical protein
MTVLVLDFFVDVNDEDGDNVRDFLEGLKKTAKHHSP